MEKSSREPGSMAYDGRVTFYEEMVTLDYLQSKPTTCFPLKSPAAVGVRGYYPPVLYPPLAQTTSTQSPWRIRAA